MSVLVLTIVVVAGISAVAFADKSVASFSLAPLYFLPLALSALVHPLRISLALSIVCLVLHDFVGPIRDLGTRHLTKDATTLLGYVFVVVVVNQLGTQRQRLADLAVKTIYASVIQFRKTTSLADDLTLVLLKKL